MVTERDASPRCAIAAPEAIGETAFTSGRASTSWMIRCHWSMERTRCSGFWMIAASATPRWPPRSGRAISCAGMRTMCACAESTRRTMFSCCPASAADMKMMTPTPMPMPSRIAAVCRRPSRRKREAAIHSKGTRLFMHHRAHAPPRLDRDVLRRHDGVALRQPGANLDPAFAAQAELDRLARRVPAVHLEHPGVAAAEVAHRFRAQRERAGVPLDLDVDRHGHVLAQVGRRIRYAQLH